MGQRLNIEIKNNEKVLANCYWHWSGYSTSSLELTKQIIEFVKSNEISFDEVGAIKIFKSLGCSFNDSSWIEAKKLNFVDGDMPECTGRNDGLIAVDEANMESTRRWEEGRININIENNEFDFDCAFEKDYIEYDDIWQRVADLFYEIKDIKSKYGIPFDKVDILLDGIKMSEKDYNGYFWFNYYCFSSIY